jgi:hypothetical protein
MSFVGGARAARRSLKPMELEQVGATLRSFVSKSGALHAVAATPLGIVTCDGTGAVFFQETDEDEPRQIDVKGVEPATLDMELKRLPPFVVDELRGEVHGPLGGLEHVAEGVLSLTRALGAPCGALSWPPATDDEIQFVVSGRDGEGVVVVIGDESFTMGEDWPPKRPVV